MRLTREQLRYILLEMAHQYGGAARDATPDEIEYLDRLRSIRRSREPGGNVESRLDRLEIKVDSILDMLGKL